MMAKGYWIPHLDVQDMKGFQAYRDLADAGHKKFGSKLLVRGGRREVLEGKMRARNVLREFKSFDEAKAYLPRAGLFGGASAARAVFGMRFPDRRGLRWPAAAPAATRAEARRAEGLLDRPYRCDRSRRLQALSGAASAAFSVFGARYLDSRRTPADHGRTCA